MPKPDSAPVTKTLGPFDVAVLGAGNAALCAAITASEMGARVAVVECAPREYRGGNSRHTRNLRSAHAAPTDILTDAYPEGEFLADVMRVTANQTDDYLARLLAKESAGCPDWMRRHGVRFQSSLRGTLHLGRTNAFFLGGGKALMNTYFALAERLGVQVFYDAEVVGLDLAGGAFRSATLRMGGETAVLHAKTVVLASGGFESNLDWLRDAWGPSADNFVVRGTPYNTGTVLRLMIDAGAESIGDPTQCHAVAVDARSPKFDGGIVTRLDCISLGVVVNRRAERFYDEGEEFWPKRYAIWGRLVARQPDQLAYAIVDAKARGHFLPSVFPPMAANSIRELAARFDLPAEALETTVSDYNRAVRPGTFDHAILDDCRTVGLTPEKTHWARPIDTPPFWGYPLRPGITFTYLGLRVDAQTRVRMADGRALPNVFAAGEIMAGNILRQGYAAGIGMTIGTVFGRLAGAEAARHAAR